MRKFYLILACWLLIPIWASGQIVINNFDELPDPTYFIMGQCSENSYINYSIINDQFYEGTGALKLDWQTEAAFDWGGCTHVEEWYSDPAGTWNFGDYSHLSIWYYNASPSTAPGFVEFRLILYDVSDSPVETNNNGEVENWLSHHYILDSQPGWNHILIPLVDVGHQTDAQGFWLPLWWGTSGNSQLDKDKIKGYSFEFSVSGGLYGADPNIANGTIYFDFFTAENPPPKTAQISFEADMTGFIADGSFDPSNPADSIVVNGSFNGWDSHEKMTPDVGNPNIYVYSTPITMIPGDNIEWKFRAFPPEKWVNLGWEIGDNRQLKFTGDDIYLDPIVPNIEYAGEPISQDVTVTFSVDMSTYNESEPFTMVSLQGDKPPINWTPGSTLMSGPNADNIWTVEIQFPAGTGRNAQYKYTAGDNPWYWEPFGGNRSFVIDDTNPSQVLDLDYWGFLQEPYYGPVWYVSTTGDNNNNGSANYPFRNINYALEKVQAGDTVYVFAGWYEESATLKSDVVLMGEGADITTINGTVFCDGQSNATFQGFTVTDDQDAGIHIYRSTATVKNCIVRNQPHSGIGCWDNSHVTVINNTVLNNGHAGVSQDNSEVILLNNIIINNNDGIGTGGTSSLVIDYNDIWNNANNYSGTASPGAHDISVNPLFVNSTSDFHLQAGSPCINAGHPDPIYNDMDGSRNDMGAFGGPGGKSYTYVDGPPSVENVVVQPAFVIIGDDVTITAYVWDAISLVSTVNAEIENPDENVVASIQLFDDGAHHDGASGDGTYGNIWTTEMDQAKHYFIDIIAVDDYSNTGNYNNVAEFDSYAPKVIYVDVANSSGVEDGSKGHPYNTISEGIESATNLDSIKVAAGIYDENPLIQSKTLYLFGGYEHTGWSRNIDANVTIIDGAGRNTTLRMYDGNSLLDGFSITNGQAEDQGGGGIDANGDIEIRNCKIYNNQGIGVNEWGAGGILIGSGSNAKILNCEIYDNYSPHGAAALRCGGMSLLMKNSLIVMNRGTAALHLNESSGEIINCTIANNDGKSNGSNPSPISFQNCICWNNPSHSWSGFGAFSWSDVEEDVEGDGNINQNPLFANEGAGDFHLQLGSPCINAGDPDPAYNDVNGSRNDMGAYGGPDGESYGYEDGPPIVENVVVQPAVVAPGNNVTITARVWDAVSSISSVQAEIESPDESVLATIDLYDDGGHNDGEAGDGTYGNSWTTPAGEADYFVDIIAADDQSHTAIYNNAGGFTTSSQLIEIINVIIDDDQNGQSYGNGDGVLNPGEFVEFLYDLHNTSSIDLIGVYGVPDSSFDPYFHPNEIYWMDNYLGGSWLNIGPGGTASGDDLDTHIGSDTPEGHIITIPIAFYDVNNTPIGNDTIRVPVTGTDKTPPRLSNASVDPKYTPVGNIATITVFAKEVGNVKNVTAYIESPDENVVATIALQEDLGVTDINNGVRWYGTWEPTTESDFVVDFSAIDAYDNTGRADNLTQFTSIPPPTPSTDILLVSDCPYENFLHFYTDALNINGYQYEVWNCNIYGEITSDYINHYINGVVIWYCGHSLPTLSENERAVLGNYLNAGGNLFITEQDLGWDLNVNQNNPAAAQWYQDYLYAIFVADDAGSRYLQGVADDPITNGLAFAIEGGDGANNQTWPSEINPISPALPILVYDGSNSQQISSLSSTRSAISFDQKLEILNLSPETFGNQSKQKSIDKFQANNSIDAAASSSRTGALRVDNGTFQVVYFAFGFEGIDNSDDRAIVMDRVIKWLQRVRISGTITYDGADRFVSDAIITLTYPEATTLDTTDVNGQYLFKEINPGDITLTPAKQGDQREAITCSDALLVLLNMAFLIDLTPEQQKAADVNEDGHVTGVDAIAILRYAAFLSSQIGHTGEWRFAPPDTSFNLSQDTHVDFKACLLGDANLNWGSASLALAKEIDNLSNADLTIGTPTIGQERELSIPILIDPSSQTMHTLLFTLAYDSTLMKLKSSIATSATQQFTVVTNDAEPGKVHLAMAGVRGINAKAELINLIFTIKDGADASSARLEFSRALINDFPAANLNAITINFDQLQVSRPQVFGLSDNYPNPFNPETMIEYQLPQDVKVTLKIYDVLGKEIKTLVYEDQKAGYYKVLWDGTDRAGMPVASGIYFYRLEADKFQAMQKMSLVR